MAKKRRKSAPARKTPPARRFRWPLLVIAVVLLGGAATALRPDSHEWHSLGRDLGRIRWVETRSDPTIDPPLAPQWVRDLRARGIPWPTDLLLEPSGASFGPSCGAEVWYLVQSSQPASDFWHIDKETVRVTDREGKEVPWPRGAGAAAVDHDRGLHYLYLGVPAELKGTGARIRFRLTRFGGPTSDEVSLPF